MKIKYINYSLILYICLSFLLGCSKLQLGKNAEMKKGKFFLSHWSRGSKETASSSNMAKKSDTHKEANLHIDSSKVRSDAERSKLRDSVESPINSSKNMESASMNKTDSTYSTNNTNNSSIPITPPPSHETPRKYVADMQEELKLYRNAQQLVKQQQFDQALVKLKSIDKSPHNQIRVNAKFLMGEIMFNRSEYDVAMQVYNDIVSQEAFSGLVIPSLERLVECSTKLNLPDKQKYYKSLLHNLTS